jgi:DNA-directed RNA polymerase subunit RPC12/RpoP
MGGDSEDHRLPRVRVDTGSESKARMRCSDCGATFPRSEARLPAKGTLVCPECDSRAIRDAVD